MMFSNNQIIPPSFHQLFPNISLCPNCTTDDWHIDFCQYIPKPSIISPTLLFKINAYMRSTQNIKYFGADPFTILIPDPNNVENLCFSEFDGQQFSLLNLETNCIKNIAYTIRLKIMTAQLYIIQKTTMIFIPNQFGK